MVPVMQQLLCSSSRVGNSDSSRTVSQASMPLMLVGDNEALVDDFAGDVLPQSGCETHTN